MFKNVLVGVDGRPNGRDAIALASHLTDRKQADARPFTGGALCSHTRSARAS